MRHDPRKGLLACEHCGSEQESPHAFSYIEVLSESTRACPLCLLPLSDSRLDGYPLRSCPRCLGLLIEVKHFVDVIESARAHEQPTSDRLPPRTQEPGERTLACPLCHLPMLNHFYGGPGNFVIDSCDRCFVNWLDAGELRRAARAPAGRSLDVD